MKCLLLYLQFFSLAWAQWNFPTWNSPPRQLPCRTPDQQSGLCISIQDCQPMLNLLDQLTEPLDKQILNYLKMYKCGSDREPPKVCCPSGPVILNVEKNNFPDVSTHRNLGLLPKKCGYFDNSDRIVGGDKAGLFEFPWMALLSYQTQRGPHFKCDGTVINNRYILTAAHCLHNTANSPLLGVRVGEYDINSVRDCVYDKWQGEICAPPYQDLRAEDVIIHPRYDPRLLTNDIALIRVSPIDLSRENIKPVCLPLFESRSYNFTNRNVVVTGWGLTERGTTSPVLLKVSLPVVPQEECQQKYRQTAKIDHRQICAGGRIGKDSCNGDSGGPLHVLGTVQGEQNLVQQGIVSFGPSKCGKSPVPGVYTRVAAFMDWILDNIRP